MPAFQFLLNKHARKLGLKGDVAWAMMHDGALQLQDDAKHVVRIAPAEISRMRLGFFDAKHRSYHTRIWRDDGETPLELVPLKQSWAGYRDTMHAFAQLLAQANRLDHVETGTSKFDALFGPALMLIPTFGAFAVSFFVLTEEPWWGRMIVPIAPTAVLAILIWLGSKRYWPTPVRDLGALQKQLPQA